MIKNSICIIKSHHKCLKTNLWHHFESRLVGWFESRVVIENIWNIGGFYIKSGNLNYTKSCTKQKKNKQYAIGEQPHGKSDTLFPKVTEKHKWKFVSWYYPPLYVVKHQKMFYSVENAFQVNISFTLQCVFDSHMHVALTGMHLNINRTI